MEVNRTTRNIIEYLVNLDPNEFRILYDDKYSCLSIYRSFNLFGQYLIRTMLYCGDKVWKVDEINKLIVQKTPLPPNVDPKIICNETLNKMLSLQLLVRKPNVEPVQVKLNDQYRKNLFSALSTFQVLPYDITEQGKKREKSFRKLEQYAKEKWEEILYYMVDQIDSDTTYIPEHERSSIKQLINEAGLLRKVLWEAEDEDEEDEGEDEKKGSLKITSDGFRFLLLDLRSQMWLLLQHYMLLQIRLQKENAEFVPRVEIIKLLFMLSYLQVGKVYYLNQLTKGQQSLLHDFSEFGIVRTQKERFFITPLALEFSKSSHQNELQNRQQQQQQSKDRSGQKNNSNIPNVSPSSTWKIPDLHGPIIVQTNFKVYAYTNSPIQIALLSFFCDLEARLPNLVIGSIERVPVRAALTNGITADQIIGYLWMHSHDKCRSLPGPPVPANVSNQIRLWEKERNRMQVQETLFYHEFSNEQIYRKLKQFADSNRWTRYFDDAKLYLLVQNSPTIEQQMNQYILNLTR